MGFWVRLVLKNSVLEQVEPTECVFLLDHMLAVFLVRKLGKKNLVSMSIFLVDNM